MHVRRLQRHGGGHRRCCAGAVASQHGRAQTQPLDGADLTTMGGAGIEHSILCVTLEDFKPGSAMRSGHWQAVEQRGPARQAQRRKAQDTTSARLVTAMPL